jgi:hypothetical protein
VKLKQKEIARSNFQKDGQLGKLIIKTLGNEKDLGDIRSSLKNSFSNKVKCKQKEMQTVIVGKLMNRRNELKGPGPLKNI